MTAYGMLGARAPNEATDAVESHAPGGVAVSASLLYASPFRLYGECLDRRALVGSAPKPPGFVPAPGWGPRKPERCWSGCSNFRGTHVFSAYP
jgi:hypothetical protein